MPRIKIISPLFLPLVPNASCGLVKGIEENERSPFRKLLTRLLEIERNFQRKILRKERRIKIRIGYHANQPRI